MRVGLRGLRGARATAVLAAVCAAMLLPTLAAGFAADGVEGTSYPGELVSAPAGCQSSPTVDWGDGGAATAATCADFNHIGTGTHTYEEEGTYAAVAHYTSPNGARETKFQLVIADAALSASGRSFSATAGAQFSGVVAHLLDVDAHGTAGDYSASVSWGDGSSSAGALSPAGGGFDVIAAHTYASAGNDTVTVGLTDAGGATASAGGSATVATAGSGSGSGGGAAPSPVRAEFTATQGAPGQVLLQASASRPSGGQVASYAWNLDGHAGSEPSALCGAEDSQMSTRLAAGTHTLTLTVTDAGGQVTSIAHQVSVPATAAARVAAIGRGRTAAAAALTQVFVCAPAPGEHPGDLTEGGGPPSGCATEVQFGLADAVGCLNRISGPGDWPVAENKIFKSLVSYARCVSPLCAGASRVASVSVAGLQAGIVSTQDPFVSYQPVRINGIDFYPHAGAAIVLLPDQNIILSSNAQMKLAGVPIKDGLVEMYVPKGSGTAGTVHIDDYTLSEQADRIGLGSFPFDGSIGLDFAYHRAQLPVHVTLPNVFTLGDGSPIEGAVTLSTDNQHSLRLDSVHVSVPDAFLGPMEIQNLFFDYQREGDAWSGGADIIFPEISLKASPPPPDQGFGIKEGHLDHIGAQLEFDPAIDLFPGVGLTHIGFTVGLDPTRFSGSVGLSVAEVVDVDGTLLGVFASPGAPYVIPAGAGAGLDPVTGRRLTSTSFAVGGAVSIDTPAGKIGLGSGYFLYQFPDYAEFGGGFFYGFHDIFSLDGHINGFVQVGKKLFNVEAGLHACVAVLGCTGVEALISSSGLAACWSQSIGPFQIDVGLGYHWGASLPDIYLLGCEVGPYRATAAAAPEAGARSFTLGANLPFATVRIQGATDAPLVTLTGPHGEKLVTPAGSNTFADANFALVHQSQSRTTFIGIKHPSAGRWTITPQTGSAPLVEVASASGLPAPKIKARVHGHGASRALIYSVVPEPGQKVAFAERGPSTWRVLTAAARSHGRLSFAPASGPAGTRQIVALVEHRGLPARQLVVASFHATLPGRPGRPGKVLLGRHGGNLTVRWGASSNASRYDVVVSLSDGRRMLFLRALRTRSLTVPGIAPSVSGRVRVSGLTRTNSAGPPASARFKARRRVTHPRLPALRA